MNLLDCYVTEVTGEPYHHYTKWWVPVKYDSWGRISETIIMLNTQEEANNVSIGYEFVS